MKRIPVKKLKYLFYSFFALLAIFRYNASAQIYLDSSYTVEERVEDLLGRMTLEEKVGQMTQANRQSLSSTSDTRDYYLGSILNGGGGAPSNNTPEGWADMYDTYQSYALQTRLMIPIIYGTDAVHGHNNLVNSVIFPHNIGMGCTRNPGLMEEAARATAIEVAATGVDWTFGPCIAVPQDERWGRTFEGFGETPELAEEFGSAAVRGFQGDSLGESLGDSTTILACAKHYLADGGTSGGVDRGNAIISEETLREIHLPGYIAAVNQGIGSVMISYSSWNGMRVHGIKYLITDVLKDELGFEGIVVSDWNGINYVDENFRTAVGISINAGIDMAMQGSNYQGFFDNLVSLVNEGQVPVSRIDDAVRRILRIKFKLGLFEKPYTNRNMMNLIGSAEHREIARECVRQSLVLLKKKDNVLPLEKDNKTILVAGSKSDNIGIQCGGWTITWQGSAGIVTEGTTILKAIQNTVENSQVVYSRYGDDEADVDVAVVVVGEYPYAEYEGDRYSLYLSNADVELVRTVKARGIPVIVIIISGRPLIINDIIPYSDAIIAAWLPGTEGQGIADVLFGDFQPAGKLSHTWPASMDQIPINYGDPDYHPLFEYGYGIDTLANSAVGSPPELYSSLIPYPGNSIELYFNKEMEDLGYGTSVFDIASNIKDIQVESIEVKETDPSTIVLNLLTPVVKDETILISYHGDEVFSDDGGKLEYFENVEVYNEMDDVSQYGYFPDSNDNDDGFIIYPNPAVDKVYIKTVTSDYSVSIFTLTGEKIKTLQAGNNTAIDISDLSQGVYIIEIKSGNGNPAYYKLIKK
jgi:beta-glucosidase